MFIWTLEPRRNCIAFALVMQIKPAQGDTFLETGYAHNLNPRMGTIATDCRLGVLLLALENEMNDACLAKMKTAALFPRSACSVDLRSSTPRTSEEPKGKKRALICSMFGSLELPVSGLAYQSTNSIFLSHQTSQQYFQLMTYKSILSKRTGW